MIEKKFSRRAAELSLFFGLLCAVFLSMAHFDAACDDLRGNVLRLHIIANSDSEADQAVKLAVRDRILKETSEIFGEGTTLAEAEKLAAENLGKITKCANSVLAENGFGYTAESELGNSYFETREYETFTLPAGNYRSLIVKLGNGEGKNWWCVVFPAVCLPAAAPDAELSDSTTETGAKIAENPKKYIARFKAVEIYEDFKKFISGK
ncbi:MAG: stage II sporulation protein R [Acutalibacteraceae bacterium]|nr:stage II sporulation protein R [Acutalibacteraceae bacterium]